MRLKGSYVTLSIPVVFKLRLQDRFLCISILFNILLLGCQAFASLPSRSSERDREEMHSNLKNCTSDLIHLIKQQVKESRDQSQAHYTPEEERRVIDGDVQKLQILLGDKRLPRLEAELHKTLQNWARLKKEYTAEAHESSSIQLDSSLIKTYSGERGLEYSAEITLSSKPVSTNKVVPRLCPVCRANNCHIDDKGRVLGFCSKTCSRVFIANCALCYMAIVDTDAKYKCKSGDTDARFQSELTRHHLFCSRSCAKNAAIFLLGDSLGQSISDSETKRSESEGL